MPEMYVYRVMDEYISHALCAVWNSLDGPDGLYAANK